MNREISNVASDTNVLLALAELESATVDVLRQYEPLADIGALEYMVDKGYAEKVDVVEVQRDVFRITERGNVIAESQRQT